MSRAAYNEIDPKAAAWLRELIKQGHIAPGDVLEASIEDLTPNDLKPYTQVHFFAGIGVWSYALRAAGWSDDRPVWTGSCPCQPFSAAGKGGGFDDERHLWPSWYWLIDQCRPPIIFGEQVASKDAEPWLDLVQADLEAVEYSLGAVPFPSAGVGAPHIRDRLYWMAHHNGERRDRERLRLFAGEPRQAGPEAAWGGEVGGSVNGQQQRRDATGSSTGGRNSRPGPTNGLWADADWLHCRDGKWRPVEPGTFPLVDGAPARVGRLRGYGNAIVAPAAQAFIEAYLEVEMDRGLRVTPADSFSLYEGVFA